MFHGGTSFGWMNGANSNGKNPTSPTSPATTTTPRSTRAAAPRRSTSPSATSIARGHRQTLPPVPCRPSRRHRIPAVQARPLRLALGQPAQARPLRPAAHHGGSRSGLRLHPLPHHDPRSRLRRPRHRRSCTTTPRSTSMANSPAPSTAASNKTRCTLHIANRSRAPRHPRREHRPRELRSRAPRRARRHRTNSVTLAGKPLTGWQIYSLPMLDPGTLPFADKPCTGACFYRGTLQVDPIRPTRFSTPAPSAKARSGSTATRWAAFWHIGPQKALYLPAPWLKAGTNQVVVFDLEGQPGRQLQGLDHPGPQRAHRKPVMRDDGEAEARRDNLIRKQNLIAESPITLHPHTNEGAIIHDAVPRLRGAKRHHSARAFQIHPPRTPRP